MKKWLITQQSYSSWWKVQSLKQSWKTDFKNAIKLSCQFFLQLGIENPFYRLQITVRIIKNKSQSSLKTSQNRFNRLNKTLLRNLKNQSVDLSKQPIELVWQQSQPKSNCFKLFQKLISVKQSIETIKQLAVFPFLFENISFKRFQDQMTLDQFLKWITNWNTTKYPTKQAAAELHTIL